MDPPVLDPQWPISEVQCPGDCSTLCPREVPPQAVGPLLRGTIPAPCDPKKRGRVTAQGQDPHTESRESSQCPKGSGTQVRQQHGSRGTDNARGCRLRQQGWVSGRGRVGQVSAYTRPPGPPTTLHPS